MDERSAGLSRGQRWLVFWITLPLTLLTAWTVVSLLAWVTPAFWTWGREPTVIEWLIRAILIAAPFVATVLVGWRMRRWVIRGEVRD